MEIASKIIERIGIVLGLTFKEAIRRKIIFFLIICCILFIGSGAGCTMLCSKMERTGLATYEKEYLARINTNEGLTPEQKAIERQKVKEIVLKQRAESNKGTRASFTRFSFTMIAFWLFMLAGIFTPFLAMNDFQSRTHVMILSRTVERWEYLVGKFLAIGGLFFVNLLILLLGTQLFMTFFLGSPSWEIVRGIGIFLQGLLVFTVMLIFISLTAGRFPAVFISIMVVVLGIVPAFTLMTGSEANLEGHWRALVYALGYGLPQYSINFLYALSEMLRDSDMMDAFRKAGNNTGFYSLIINTGWFIVFWALSIFIFNRKEIDT